MSSSEHNATAEQNVTGSAQDFWGRCFVIAAATAAATAAAFCLVIFCIVAPDTRHSVLLVGSCLLGLSAAIWIATALSVRALDRRMRDRTAEVTTAHRAEVDRLAEAVADLRQLLDRDGRQVTALAESIAAGTVEIPESKAFQLGREVERLRRERVNGSAVAPSTVPPWGHQKP